MLLLPQPYQTVCWCPRILHKRITKHKEMARRLAVVSPVGLISKMLKSNTFENTIFELDPGTTYEDNGIKFMNEHMSLVHRGEREDVLPAELVIDCKYHRCFDFQNGYVPFKLFGILFRNGRAPHGEHGGVINLDNDAKYSGPLYIINCIFESNTAIGGNGGAIFVSSAPQKLYMHRLYFQKI